MASFVDWSMIASKENEWADTVRSTRVQTIRNLRPSILVFMHGLHSRRLDLGAWARAVVEIKRNLFVFLEFTDLGAASLAVDSPLVV